jgi:hypothetical protein
MASGGRVLNAIDTWFSRFLESLIAIPDKPIYAPLSGLLSRFHRVPGEPRPAMSFPRILDKYVVREFLKIFFLVLAGFVSLILVFTVFDLLGDILATTSAGPRSAST